MIAKAITCQDHRDLIFPEAYPVDEQQLRIHLWSGIVTFLRVVVGGPASDSDFRSYLQ
jgi:hypothetical protein